MQRPPGPPAWISAEALQTGPTRLGLGDPLPSSAGWSCGTGHDDAPPTPAGRLRDGPGWSSSCSRSVTNPSSIARACGPPASLPLLPAWVEASRRDSGSWKRSGDLARLESSTRATPGHTRDDRGPPGHHLLAAADRGGTARHAREGARLGNDRCRTQRQVLTEGAPRQRSPPRCGTVDRPPPSPVRRPGGEVRYRRPMPVTSHGGDVVSGRRVALHRRKYAVVGPATGSPGRRRPIHLYIACSPAGSTRARSAHGSTPAARSWRRRPQDGQAEAVGGEGDYIISAIRVVEALVAQGGGRPTLLRPGRLQRAGGERRAQAGTGLIIGGDRGDGACRRDVLQHGRRRS